MKCEGGELLTRQKKTSILNRVTGFGQKLGSQPSKETTSGRDLPPFVLRKGTSRRIMNRLSCRKKTRQKKEFIT